VVFNFTLKSREMDDRFYRTTIHQLHVTSFLFPRGRNRCFALLSTRS